jgi:hypothetical protein
MFDYFMPRCLVYFCNGNDDVKFSVENPYGNLEFHFEQPEGAKFANAELKIEADLFIVPDPNY